MKHEVTKPGVLLPLHRALTELFFVAESRVSVSHLLFFVLQTTDVYSYSLLMSLTFSVCRNLGLCRITCLP